MEMIMENTAIREKVKEIKQSFRLMMDGAVAKSMRDKGLNYKLNWGATLPRLRQKADEIGYNYDLAIALWKEDVRECKILATMIMPPDEVLPEVIDIWMEQTTGSLQPLSASALRSGKSLSVDGLRKRAIPTMRFPYSISNLYG